MSNTNTRITEVGFLKDVVGLGQITVAMHQVDSIVLHDVMLAELFHLSDSIPDLSLPVGTGIYETRDAILRVLDRLTSRPKQTAGRSSMCINKQRITVAETEAIRCALKKLVNCDDKEMLKRLRVTGSNLNANVRRERLVKILKYVEEAKGLKIPVISPDDMKGEKGPAPCTPVTPAA